MTDFSKIPGYDKAVQKFSQVISETAMAMVEEICARARVPLMSANGTGIGVGAINAAAVPLVMTLGKCKEQKKCKDKDCCGEPMNRVSQQALRFALLVAVYACKSTMEVEEVDGEHPNLVGFEIETSSETMHQALVAYRQLFPDSPPEKYISPVIMALAKEQEKKVTQALATVDDLLAKIQRSRPN